MRPLNGSPISVQNMIVCFGHSKNAPFYRERIHVSALPWRISWRRLKMPIFRVTSLCFVCRVIARDGLVC